MLTAPMLALGVRQDEIDHIKPMKIRDKDTRAHMNNLEMKLNKIEESMKSFNFNNIPPVANFFSRDKEVDELHNKLVAAFRSKLGVVLHGFPGLGKSETARKYWFKFGKSHYDDSPTGPSPESVGVQYFVPVHKQPEST